MATDNNTAPAIPTPFKASDEPMFCIAFDDAAAQPALLVNPGAAATTLLSSARARVDRALTVCRILARAEAPGEGGANDLASAMVPQLEEVEQLLAASVDLLEQPLIARAAA